MNGDPIEDHPIIHRLIFFRQFLARLKPIYKKLDFQISRLVSLSNKDISDINWSNQDDPMMMRPNLGIDQMLDDGEHDDIDHDDDEFKKEVDRRVNRAMENGYGKLDKYQKKAMVSAIRAKREKLGQSNDRKSDQFNEFRRKRLLQSNIVKNMENELEERPFETTPRPNIKGVYDPMQDKRDRMDDKNFSNRVLTKEQKKSINKRVERLKAMEKVDDLSEVKGMRELITGKKIELSSTTSKDKKKKNNWIINKDEEKYDSKRQAKLRRSSKIKHKKKAK